MRLVTKLRPLPKEENEDGNIVFSDMLPAILFATIFILVAVAGLLVTLVSLVGMKNFFLCLSPFALFFLFEYFYEENEKIHKEQ
jgi:hypothetical protein